MLLDWSGEGFLSDSSETVNARVFSGILLARARDIWISRIALRGRRSKSNLKTWVPATTSNSQSAIAMAVTETCWPLLAGGTECTAVGSGHHETNNEIERMETAAAGVRSRCHVSVGGWSQHTNQYFPFVVTPGSQGKGPNILCRRHPCGTVSKKRKCVSGGLAHQC